MTPPSRVTPPYPHIPTDLVVDAFGPASRRPHPLIARLLSFSLLVFLAAVCLLLLSHGERGRGHLQVSRPLCWGYLCHWTSPLYYIPVYCFPRFLTSTYVVLIWFVFFFLGNEL